jgi:hypothetical protein
MKSFILICCLSVSLNPEIWASGERIPAGGKAAGMCGTAVASCDFWSLRNNQAGLAWLKSVTAGLAYENRFLLADISMQDVGAAIPFRFGTVGISIARNGNNLYNELHGGIAYARKFGKAFSMGVQFDYGRLHLAGDYGSKSYISCQIGMIYRPDRQFTLGVHILNPVPVKIIDQPGEYLPAGITLGLAWELSDAFLTTIEIEKDLLNLPVFRGGAEYHFSKPLYARIGLSTNPVSFSFGFGIETGRFAFDFASGYHPLLGFSPSGSLVYSFKK